MCGFFIILKKKKISKKKFLSSANLLRHRGPDNESFYENSKLIGKFFRLSIRDHSNESNQPIHSKDGRYTLFFNGEIYNTKELINKYNLSKKFDLKSDTKILLYLLCKFNTKILNELRGMFSIFFFDNLNKTSLLIRDRFGIKPLYFASYEKGIIISSEQKPILKMINKKPEINNKAAFQFFIEGKMDHNEETFFKKIYSVKPGYLVKIKNNKISKHRYWELTNKKDKHNFKESLIKLKKKLSQSINEHLISDEKIGYFLSGGEDSSYLVNSSKKEVNAFTYEFKDHLKNKNNEINNAKKTLKKIRRKKHFTAIISKKNLEKNIYEIVKLCESPITSIRLIGEKKCYQLAKKNKIKVIIEGHCGDELLAGYLNNLVPSYYDKFGSNKAISKIFTKSNKEIYGYNKLKDLIFCLNNQGICTSDGTKYLEVELFNKNFIKKYSFASKKYDSKMKDFNFLKRSQYLEYFYYHTPRNLRYLDRLSMAYGVESRIPFLDHRLVEYCFNLRNEKKIYKNTQRYIIKMLRPNLKNSTNEKKSITDPQREWFSKNILSNLLKKELKTINHKDKIFNKKNILALLNNNSNTMVNNSFNLMTIYTFLIFKKIFNFKY